jgi:hypothetical protein
MKRLARAVVIFTVPVLVVGTALPAWAASWHLQQAAQPGDEQALLGVSTLSSTSAWAVGYYFGMNGSLTLIEHYNGTSWKQAASPDPSAKDNELEAVKAYSVSNVWAVGYYLITGGYHPLAEHYDGTSWTVASIPDVPNGLLYAIGGSASNVWVVGAIGGSPTEPFSEHYDGTSWTIVPMPQEPGTTILYGVTAPNASQAWAAGTTTDGAGNLFTLVDVYDGTSWTTESTPNPSATNNQLTSISAASASDIWAAGDYIPNSGTHDRSLLLHFDGTTWHQILHPHSGVADQLEGIKTVSATDVWAVGGAGVQGGGNQTLILHYDGTGWSIVPSPNRSGGNELYGVGSNSSKNAFAVGDYQPPGTNGLALILHCRC